jgi:hypothetical protein
VVDHRPANLRPPIRQHLVHDDYIHRSADPADGIAQTDGLSHCRACRPIGSMNS